MIEWYPPTAPRDWDVLLIGGASGVGKTSISYRIARHFGVGITEVDDFQVLLEVMTTPEQQPALHYWATHPEAIHAPPETIFERLMEICHVMTPALNAVIANHLESQTPVVLEGDFILPALAAQAMFRDQPNQGRVKAVFIEEADEAQIVRNYLSREPNAGEQSGRAHVSKRYNDWLRGEATRLKLPVVAARPWGTLFERVLEALNREAPQAG
ncbi:MAG: hypothetical protein U0670_22235 [Anaerolineae bacterium]